MSFDGWIGEGAGSAAPAQGDPAGAPASDGGTALSGEGGAGAGPADPPLTLDSFLVLDGDTIFFEFDTPFAILGEPPEAGTGDARYPEEEVDVDTAPAADVILPEADDAPGDATFDVALADGSSDWFEPAFEFLPVEAPSAGSGGMSVAMTAVEPTGDFMPPLPDEPIELPEGDSILPPEAEPPTLPESDSSVPDDAGLPDALDFLLA